MKPERLHHGLSAKRHNAILKRGNRRIVHAAPARPSACPAQSNNKGGNARACVHEAFSLALLVSSRLVSTL